MSHHGTAQCWHWCPFAGGHDWTHPAKPTSELDAYFQACPAHRDSCLVPVRKRRPRHRGEGVALGRLDEHVQYAVIERHDPMLVHQEEEQ